MIKLHRLQGQAFVLNAHLICTVEAAPDTVITLVNGQKFVVRESVEDVIQKTVEYRRLLGKDVFPCESDVDAGVLGERRWTGQPSSA